MTNQVLELRLEEAIEAALLAGGPDEPPPTPVAALAETRAPYDTLRSGGYQRRRPDEYVRNLCLLPRDLVDFLQSSQPKEWLRFSQQHGSAAKDRLYARVSAEVGKRGTLDVLRKGVKDAGVTFRLAFFPPASSLNPESQRHYRLNVFSVVRQLRFSEKNDDSLDLALFLNGLPLFTAELKNPFNGQTVEDAVAQYRRDRDPREPLFAFGRCLAHFAVDPDLVEVTTHLKGQATRFLPFNRGRFGGAGNEPEAFGYSTKYLWEETWAPWSVLNLVHAFVHEVALEDGNGKKTGERALIFPRYHQLDAVRRLVEDARRQGPGQRYLIQHSAGSGKSNSIAWLAHQLSVLHDAMDERVFDSIIVITDRRLLDRQLQQTIRQFEQIAGVVENITEKSVQLKEALERGKTIIVTTLQKFPFITEQIGELPGERFAIIADEAHSSQGGEAAGRSLKAVFAPKGLDEAEREDAGDVPDGEEWLLEQMRKRQFARLPNVSVFAFTATPKPKTLELFGTRQPDGSFKPFSLYSMRQAIDEKFILDVLENYTTYQTYWSLLKTVEDDPRYDRAKASSLLRTFVDSSEPVIATKVATMVEHFHGQVSHRIGGRAKAMIVTRSRLHAARYRLAVDAYLKEKGYPYRAAVAFSGTVRDPDYDIEYTEPGMNGFPEAQTAKMFERFEYRFLVVAEKFQTGFDQPLLHTMYVDKKLQDLNAVQTLSRLNRIHPDKQDTMVLDFVNDADAIQKSFEPYYEATILSEGTDPNLLYDLQRRLLDFHVFGEKDAVAFLRLWRSGATQDRHYRLLDSIKERFDQLGSDEAADFRQKLNDYVRLYAFLSQLLTFADVGLEKLCVFGRFVLRVLPAPLDALPREIQNKIDIESYRMQKTSEGAIRLTRGKGELDPMAAKPEYSVSPDELEALSSIIRELNERFGTTFADEDKVFLRTLEERLGSDVSLRLAVNTNPPESARLTFDLKARDGIENLIDTGLEFYKRVNGDPEFAKFLLDVLFDRFCEQG